MQLLALQVLWLHAYRAATCLDLATKPGRTTLHEANPLLSLAHGAAANRVPSGGGASANAATVLCAGCQSIAVGLKSNRECTAFKKCKVGEWTAVKGTPTSDVTCAVWTKCKAAGTECVYNNAALAKTNPFSEGLYSRNGGAARGDASHPNCLAATHSH